MSQRIAWILRIVRFADRLAPITSKGMINAMAHHSNNRLLHGSIPLSHYFGTCR